MEEKVSGIVLSAISFGENDKILNIFTLEKGVVSAKIKGVKKAGAKLKFASEPFCFAEYILRESKAGYTVINASLIESFYCIREDIIKYFCGGAILEFVRRFYKEGIVDTDGFLSTVEALKKVAFGDDALSDTSLFFIEGLKRVGFALYLDGCFLCKCKEIERVFFDYKSGAFYCDQCFFGEGKQINSLTFKALKKLVKGEGVSKEENLKVLRLIDYYVENRVEESIKSLKELLKMLV